MSLFTTAWEARICNDVTEVNCPLTGADLAPFKGRLTPESGALLTGGGSR